MFWFPVVIVIVAYSPCIKEALPPTLLLSLVWAVTLFTSPLWFEYLFSRNESGTFFRWYLTTFTLFTLLHNYDVLVAAVGGTGLSVLLLLFLAKNDPYPRSVSNPL